MREGLARVARKRGVLEDDLGRNIPDFKSREMFRAFHNGEATEEATQIKWRCEQNPFGHYGPAEFP